ncbi:MAG: hypothetical protein WD885_01965 [Candidatus Saccharimonadales bacterium]
MLFALGLILVLCFGLVIFFGAPYLPALKNQKLAALELLSLKPGQTMLELGSGDGRVLKAAAERGIYAVGYELNPVLILVSRLVTLKQRHRVKIIWGNYWTKDWEKADGIYVFLYTDYMKKLNKKISGMGKKIKLVSVTFKIPGKKPIKEKEGVFLYQY